MEATSLSDREPRRSDITGRRPDGPDLDLLAAVTSPVTAPVHTMNSVLLETIDLAGFRG